MFNLTPNDTSTDLSLSLERETDLLETDPLLELSQDVARLERLRDVIAEHGLAPDLAHYLSRETDLEGLLRATFSDLSTLPQDDVVLALDRVLQGSEEAAAVVGKASGTFLLLGGIFVTTAFGNLINRFMEKLYAKDERIDEFLDRAVNLVSVRMGSQEEMSLEELRPDQELFDWNGQTLIWDRTLAKTRKIRSPHVSDIKAQFRSAREALGFIRKIRPEKVKTKKGWKTYAKSVDAHLKSYQRLYGIRVKWSFILPTFQNSRIDLRVKTGTVHKLGWSPKSCRDVLKGVRDLKAIHEAVLAEMVTLNDRVQAARPVEVSPEDVEKSRWQAKAMHFTYRVYAVLAFTVINASIIANLTLLRQVFNRAVLRDRRGD